MTPTPHSNNNECLSPLDEKLRQLALTDWAAFTRLIGQATYNRMKVCMLKRQKKSIRFIAGKVGVSKSSADRACKKCPD